MKMSEFGTFSQTYILFSQMLAKVYNPQDRESSLDIALRFALQNNDNGSIS